MHLCTQKNFRKLKHNWSVAVIGTFVSLITTNIPLKFHPNIFFLLMLWPKQVFGSKHFLYLVIFLLSFLFFSSFFFLCFFIRIFLLSYSLPSSFILSFFSFSSHMGVYPCGGLAHMHVLSHPHSTFYIPHFMSFWTSSIFQTFMWRNRTLAYAWNLSHISHYVRLWDLVKF
jgi:hypothetical protein